MGTVRTCPALPRKVGYDPVLFAELYGLDVQAEQLPASKSASDQHGEDRIVPFATERIAARTHQKPLVLFRREPVPYTNRNPAYSFDPPDPGRKFRTQKAGIGRLLRDRSDGSNGQVDRRRCVQFLFEKDSVSQNYGALERQTVRRAVPVHKIGHGAVVGSAGRFWT